MEPIPTRNPIELLRIGWYFRILFVATIVFSVLILRLPLLKDGDYEFAEVLSLWLFPVCSLAAVRLHRNRYPFWRSLLFLQIPIVLSFVVLLVGGCGCSPLRSLFFFLALPVTSAFVGTCCGWAIAYIAGKKAVVSLMIFWLASLLIQIGWLIWFVPISVYSVWWGYFAGPVYDTWIPMQSILLVHRLYSIIWATLLLFLPVILYRRASRLLVGSTGILLLILLLGFYYREEVGFDLTYPTLEKTLSRSAHSGLITVHADPQVDEPLTLHTARLAEFQYTDMARLLEISHPPPVRIYVYRDAIQKKQLFGAGPTNFAKIWNQEIHVNASDAASVVKHELVHVLSTTFGNRWYGSAQIGLLEGLAVAMEWEGDFFTPHEWSALLLARNELPSVAALVGGRSFFSGSASLSYTVTGSFVRFLVDSLGSEGVKALFAGKGFSEAFHIQIEEAEMLWRASLRRIPVDTNKLAAADWLLQPGVFQKRCVHATADRLHDADLATNSGNLVRAGQELNRALQLNPESAWLLLRYLRLQFMQGVPDQKRLDSLATSESTPFSVRLASRLFQADVAFSEGLREAAIAKIQNLSSDASSHGLSEEAVHYRRFIYRQENKAVADSLLRFGTTMGKILSLHDSTSEGKLWLAQACLAEGEFQLAYDLLRDLPDFAAESMELLRLQLCATACGRVGRYGEAIRTAEIVVRKSERNVDRLRWNESIRYWKWLEKSAW